MIGQLPIMPAGERLVWMERVQVVGVSNRFDRNSLARREFAKFQLRGSMEGQKEMGTDFFGSLVFPTKQVTQP